MAYCLTKTSKDVERVQETTLLCMDYAISYCKSLSKSGLARSNTAVIWLRNNQGN